MAEAFSRPLPGPRGSTRTSVAFDHALIAPDGHVPSPLAGWPGAKCVVLISPAMGAAPRAPRFTMYVVPAVEGVKSAPASPGVQRLGYLLEGAGSFAGEPLAAGSFVYTPPGDTTPIELAAGATMLVFEKPYTPLAGLAPPAARVGRLADSPVEPFLGDPDAMLATLLPIEPAFDMAVNVFTYQSGARLPFVETHVMEHGLYMSAGEGVYRLGDRWYPVEKGDSIWMAAYCPQWFVAMGKGPAQYVYYKDIHRDPLQP
jgi:(S)-ureidoglycine aminohydrolase